MIETAHSEEALGSGTSERIDTAARWLNEHRSELTRPAIPVLRERFGLTNSDAIAATKQAHALAYPRA